MNVVFLNNIINSVFPPSENIMLLLQRLSGLNSSGNNGCYVRLAENTSGHSDEKFQNFMYERKGICKLGETE
jgi:hypothetical protein